MKIVFICQAVDQDEPILATTIKWIESFARHPQVEEMVVISLRVGEFSLPDNVTVYQIQRNNRLLSLLRFYGVVLSAIIHNKADFFFIYQGGPYPVLLLPFRLLMGKSIYQWKALPYISPQMRFYARYCNTKIFTSTPNAFPMALPKVKIVGQGVDVEKFCPKPAKKIGDIVTVGRIAPIKRLDVMLHVLDYCNRRYGKFYRFDIYGSDLDKYSEHRKYLENLIKALHLFHQVSLKGVVKHDDLPAILNTYRVFINLSDTALDRAVVEAMACGLPVLSTNICVADILPQDLKPVLFVPRDDLHHIGTSLHELLSQSETDLARIGKTLRKIVVQSHSVEKLIDNILAEIRNSD